MAFIELWRSKERHADAGVISTGWQACVRTEGGREEERDGEQMRLLRRKGRGERRGADEIVKEGSVL